VTAPSTWAAPSDQGSPATTAVGHVTYANGYWFVATRPSVAGGAPALRYATDPTGTWTDVSFTNPSGATSDFMGRVFYDGTNYGFLFDGIELSPTRRAIYTAYATTPSGSWTVGTASAYTPNQRLMESSNYINGEWVIVGWDETSSVGFVGTSSSISGSFSWDTTGHGLPSGDRVVAVDYDGSHYLMSGFPTSTSYWRYSTSLTGSWTAVTDLNATSWAPEQPKRLWHPTPGYWFKHIDTTSDAAQYATTATETTWGVVADTDFGLAGTRDFAASGDYWVAVGDYVGASKLAYSASTGAPSGTWTAISGGFSGTNILGVDYGGDYFVGVDTNGNIRYSYAPVTPTAAISYLRQRQSPVRAPSRVRGIDLRQRQTPIIVR